MLDWLFGKKPPPEPPSVDQVWIDAAARDRALVRAAEAGPVDVMTFFDDTLDHVRRVLDRPGVRLQRADRITTLGSRILVAERHPLPAENRALLERIALLAPGVVPVFLSHLDDPLLRRFGGDRLRDLMIQLGLGPDEPVEHGLVTKALANAREKVAAKATGSTSTRSMEEWLTLNLGAQRPTTRE